MKLLTNYTRANLLVMLGVFLLSATAYYLLMNYVLVREMNADLVGIEQQVHTYVNQYHALPKGYSLDETEIDYQLTDSVMKASDFSVITRYSQREKKMHNFGQIVFTLPLEGHLYKVTISKLLQGLHHLSRAVILISLGTILMTILVSLLFNRIVLRRLWQPFYDALNTMRQFKLGGNQQLHFPETRIDEFTFMNESLGLAAEKAQQDYLLLKEFTENASHELQTPLSIIRSKLDLLIQEENLSHRQSEIVRSAYAAIRKLYRLNQSLLLLAKISNQQFNHIESIDLKEKIEDKLLQFQELWEAHEVKVSAQLEATHIRASAELIDILLNNLFSNAINHNMPKGTIDIELLQDRLIVSNTGASVPLDAQRVFNRFYKGDQHTGNNGLGLSIIRQICEVTSLSATYQFSNNRHIFTLTW